MKTKFWQYLRAGTGAPISSATINVYVYPVGGGIATYAYIYPTIDGSPTTTDVYSLTTDANGYFEFYIADIEESSTYGYSFTREFKITWQKAGYPTGTIDKVQLFDVANREVDETKTDSNKNKMISNYQAKLWNEHVTLTTVDNHTQYLRTDGARTLTGNWDIGASRKISAEQIQARPSGTLKLTDDANLGIIVQDGGRVDINNVNIDGGTIDGVVIATSVAALSSVNIDGGVIDNTIIGSTTPTSGYFSWINIDNGLIDNTIIGASIPASGTFLGISANTAVLSNILTDSLHTPLIDTGTGYITDRTLSGNWNCSGIFSVGSLAIASNVVYATTNSGISLQNDNGRGIWIPDSGLTSVGISAAAFAQFNIVSHATHLRLQYDNVNYAEMDVNGVGALTLTTNGTSPLFYISSDVNLSNNVLLDIGTSASFFTNSGDLNIRGYCNAVTFEINGHTVLQCPDHGNLCVGVGAGENTVIGFENTFIGKNSGFNNNSGSFNITIGPSAGYEIDSGDNNLIIGYEAGRTITTGERNVIIGNYAGQYITGSKNVIIGHDTAYYADVGSSMNTYIGAEAGYWATGGQGNVFIGYRAGRDVTGAAASGSGKLYIANSESPIPLLYGDFTEKYIGIQNINPQFELDINGDIRISNFGKLYFGGLETVHPSGYITMDGDEFLISTTTTVSGGLYVAGDNIARAGALGLTNVHDTGIAAGTGTIKMCGASNRNSTGFIKIYTPDGNTRYVPYFTDITG
jgi:hypothetical protein